MHHLKVLILISIMALLEGCASSDLSRTTAGQVDEAVHNSSASISHLTSGNITDSYQNSSQTTKGLLLGSAAGAIVGGVTSGVGLFPGAIEGAIFGSALGAYIDSHTTLTDRLINRGVKAVVLGDQVLIVVPSRMIFNEMTAEINPSAYSTLDAVSELINGYPNLSVKISAYTNETGPESVNLALSNEQARSVERYLWSRGVNTRVLSAAGYGGQKLVEKNSMAWDSGSNYRIEITLEALPV